MWQFIKQIREANELVRKRWLIAFSTITVLAVIGLWLVYFNTTLTTINSPTNNQLADKSGPIPTLKVGLSATSKKTITGLANSYVFFKDKFSDRNGFTISRANQNFIWDDLEEVPVQKLP